MKFLKLYKFLIATILMLLTAFLFLKNYFDITVNIHDTYYVISDKHTYLLLLLFTILITFLYVFFNYKLKIKLSKQINFHGLFQLILSFILIYIISFWNNKDNEFYLFDDLSYQVDSIHIFISTFIFVNIIFLLIVIVKCLISIFKIKKS